MELVEWKDNTIIGNKKIICFGAGERFEDFVKINEVADRIYRIIDNDNHKHGISVIDEQEYIVCGIDCLKEVGNINDVIIVITSVYYEEIFKQIKDYIKEGIDTVYYFLAGSDSIKIQFRQKYNDLPLDNLIIFRSGPTRNSYIPGTDFSDNARALYEYMICNGINKKYKIVWLVKELSIERETPYNVKFISMDGEDSADLEERDYYYKCLYTAKFIFFTDAYGFASFCKPNQIRVQLWHGCGFKTRVNFCRCENRYEYTTVVSELYAKIHAELYGLRADQVLVTGYAKHDWLFQPYKHTLSEILEITSASKYIFWCPTFRMAQGNLEMLNQYVPEGKTGLPIIRTEGQLLEVNDLLRKGDTTLIVKLHPFQKKDLINVKNLSNVRIIYNEEVVEKDLIINRLLASADALISDYSSIAIDFLNCNKPIAFTLDDVDLYNETRGFIFDNIRDYLPGKEIVSYEDFYEFIKEIIEGYDSTVERRKRISQKLLKYSDSKNCERIIETLGI